MLIGDKLCLVLSVPKVVQGEKHHQQHNQQCRINIYTNPHEDQPTDLVNAKYHHPSIISFYPGSEMLSLASYRRQAQLRNQ